jgi:hypothetical protein
LSSSRDGRYYGYGWFSPPPRMSLPEAIFSFVFGDGDPNSALRAARVRALAETIRANGGAVVAEVCFAVTTMRAARVRISSHQRKRGVTVARRGRRRGL